LNKRFASCRRQVIFPCTAASSLGQRRIVGRPSSSATYRRRNIATPLAYRLAKRAFTVEVEVFGDLVAGE
jgi:hypothetical protein